MTRPLASLRKEPLSLPAVRGLALAALLFGLGAMSLGGCLMGGGSDTETVEPLTGLLVGPDGTPVAGAQVKLVPTDFDPRTPDRVRVLMATTDTHGLYRFAAEDLGANAYNLLAASEGRELAAFAGSVGAATLPDTVTLAKARVFLITLHSASYVLADSGKAWFPGTDILVRCEGVVDNRLEGVPTGLSRMVVESRAGWRHEFEAPAPGDTLRILADDRGVRTFPR